MDSIFQMLKGLERYSKYTELIVGLAMVGIIGVMIFPMAPWMLDFSLVMVIMISLLVLILSIYSERALDFSVFPTVLLMATLFRLALNVATTRLILKDGHSGAGSAGHVIEAFGSVVIGDNYVIGFVVFTILVIINFIVITKGSGRVAEVAARFTLDSLPGKQMSIDADLNAGLINEEMARKRRQEIEQEADFYGAMDGASKFVRGDAIAAIVITIVNVIGGLLIGVLDKGLDVAQAAKIYTMLTIGDGLVSQIPALIISTAAGIIVTRSGSAKSNTGNLVTKQLTSNPKAIYMVAGMLAVIGLIPGLPLFPFFTMAAIASMVAWSVQRFQREAIERKRKEEADKAQAPDKEKVENLLPLDLLELEVGYGLISVVESEQSGDLLERIVSIRKQFALDLGIIVPSIHIRDNLQLQPGEYQLLIKGNKVAGGTLMPDNLLAMDPGNITRKIDGVPTKEPAFGLDAIWVSKSQKEAAELSGYTVVDLPTVIATHITEIIRSHAHEILGRQEASNLIDNFKANYPKVVDELIPEILSLGTVVQVLPGLLREQVSIRDLRTIFETLADEGPRSKDVEVLIENVRKRLSRNITMKYRTDDGSLTVLSLSPHIEELISNSLLQTEQGVQLVMDPRMAQSIITEIAKTIENTPEVAAQPVILTSPSIRRHLRKLLERFIPQVAVLSHNEVSLDVNVQSAAIVEVANAS
ncbi:MAG: flagellar biosynthesis protein FlhA [Bdellovibrionales bacterium]|nr:flagellar biosynthesis protein FlhA [Bdellovibrionales bacterium]